jgi:hypothetical protein
VTNKRSNFTWCLSAPNGNDTQVFAEICAPGVPQKQRWRPAGVPNPNAAGWNWIKSLNTNDQCITAVINTTNGGPVVMRPCHPQNGNQNCAWSP